MEMIRIRSKGYILIEVIVAILVFSIVASGIMIIFIKANKNSSQATHKAEAIYYASSVADTLLAPTEDFLYVYQPSMGDFLEYEAPELKLGLHTKETDPGICTLPESYFTEALGGELKYNIEDIPIEGTVHRMWRVTITVSWQEQSPEVKAMQEDLVTVVFIYDSSWV